MVHVFTPEFLATLTRYDNKPGWFAPKIRFLATSPDRADVRAWIEDQVEFCDPDARAKLIPRLRSGEQLISTLHELAVMAVLREAGLEPRYEVTLPGTELTPDLLVPATDAEAPVIVEVWTRRPPDEVRRQDDGWEELRERVARIPAGLALRVEAAPGKTLRPPAGGEAKAVAAELRPQLLRMTTGPGTVFDIGPYRFYVLATVPGLGAFLLPPRSGGWVGTNELVDGIGEKVSRYTAAATAMDAKLVVVVAADGVPADIEFLRGGMNGQQSLVATFNLTDSGLIAEQKVQLSDGTPARFDPALSAVGLLTTPPPTPKLELLPHVGAAQPLAWPDTRSMITWVA